jgi:hypothetical protein
VFKSTNVSGNSEYGPASRALLACAYVIFSMLRPTLLALYTAKILGVIVDVVTA